MGVDPDRFWDYTVAEAFSILKRLENGDRLHWNHTSSLMCLLANINSSKSKTFKPDDFNPYQVEKAKKEFKNRDEVMEFVKTFSK